MAVKIGIDYVYADEITYSGFEGMGKGCLIGTHKILLQIPTRTIETQWFIDDKPVRD